MARRTWNLITKETADTVLELKMRGYSPKQIARRMGRTKLAIGNLIYRLNKNPKLYDHVEGPDKRLQAMRYNMATKKKQPELPENLPSDPALGEGRTKEINEAVVKLLTEKYWDSLSVNEKLSIISERMIKEQQRPLDF